MNSCCGNHPVNEKDHGRTYRRNFLIYDTKHLTTLIHMYGAAHAMRTKPSHQNQKNLTTGVLALHGRQRERVSTEKWIIAKLFAFQCRS